MNDDPFAPIEDVAETDASAVVEDEPAPLELGVYFGLDERIYHSDEGLGSTSMVDLAKWPPGWQHKRLRGSGDDEVRTEAMKWGSAFHCRVLEGKDAFDHRYAQPPTPKDFPKALNTTDQIRDFLREHGQKLTGKKDDLVERAKRIDECPPFFEEILAAFHAERPEYESLNAKQMQEIEDAVANMQREPILNAVMQAGSLMDGAAEMSIIYEHEGIRRKARYDYGLPPTKDRSASLIVDLKSFTTFRRGTQEQAAIDAIYEKCYDVQAASYFDALPHARAALEEGRVFGDAPDDDFLERFLSAPEYRWVWLMLRRDNGLIPTLLSVPEADPIISHARAIIDTALSDYREYVARFGLKQLWTPQPRMPRVIKATDFPSYNRGILHEQPSDR